MKVRTSFAVAISAIALSFASAALAQETPPWSPLPEGVDPNQEPPPEPNISVGDVNAAPSSALIPIVPVPDPGLVPTDPLVDASLFRLRNRQFKNLCLDIDVRGGHNDGTPARLWECNNVDNGEAQRWKRDKISGNDVTIQWARTPNEHCLDGDIQKGNGAPVEIWKCGPNSQGVRDHQLWQINEDGTVRSKNGDFCLEADENGGQNGTAARLWECGRTGEHKKWDLEPF